MLADRAQKLGEYCRFNNSLPKDLSELAICLIGRHFKAQFEFYAHARLAKEAGLSADIVEAIRVRATPPFKRDVEKVVYDFVTEYLETNRVATANYKRVIDAFGEQGVVDLVGVCGYYMLVSMTPRTSSKMPLPPGEPDPARPETAEWISRASLFFFAAALAIAISPGPGLLYVAARTLAGGLARRPWLRSFGTGLGGLVHVVAGAIGVSALVLASAEAFAVLKIAGAIYLVCWASRVSVRSGIALETKVAATGGARAFREGIVVEALNPKTAAFFLAFLPQFVDPATGPVWLQFVVLGLISVTLTTAVDVVVTFLAARARAAAVARPGLLRRLRQGAGLAIAFTRRLAFLRATPSGSPGVTPRRSRRRASSRPKRRGSCAGSRRW